MSAEVALHDLHCNLLLPKWNDNGFYAPQKAFFILKLSKIKKNQYLCSRIFKVSYSLIDIYG